MTDTLAIKNGVVAGRQAAVCVRGGVIESVGAIPADFRAAGEIDAAGGLIVAGLADFARLPADYHLSATRRKAELDAAAAGGITTVFACSPPQNGGDDGGLGAAGVRQLAELADGDGRMADIPARRAEGAVAFVLRGAQTADTRTVWRLLQLAATHDALVLVSPRDPFLSADAVVADGARAARLGLAAMPPAAEIAQTARLTALAEAAGARLHFCRLSVAGALDAVAAAKARGANITCDAAAANLLLAADDGGDFDPRFYLWPPLGDSQNRAALAQAAASGLIDFIVSDHRAFPRERADAPDGAPRGASGFGLLPALILRWAGECRIDPAEAFARTNVARCFDITDGALKAGARADLTVVDLDAEWTVDEAALAPFGRSPFHGARLRGRACAAVCGGRLAFAAPR